MLIFYASGFSYILSKITPFANDIYTFFQTVATLGFPAIIAYYKVREAFAEVQQDQMYSQKVKAVLGTLLVIFFAKPIVEVITYYFLK